MKTVFDQLTEILSQPPSQDTLEQTFVRYIRDTDRHQYLRFVELVDNYLYPEMRGIPSDTRKILHDAKVANDKKLSQATKQIGLVPTRP